MRARIEEKRARAERIKALNAAIRREMKKGDGWLGRIGATAEDLAAIHRNVEFDWRHEPAFPGYVLSNLRNSIRADEERIRQIEARERRRTEAEEAGGVLVKVQGEYAAVTFAEKPARTSWRRSTTPASRGRTAPGTGGPTGFLTGSSRHRSDSSAPGRAGRHTFEPPRRRGRCPLTPAVEVARVTRASGTPGTREGGLAPFAAPPLHPLPPKAAPTPGPQVAPHELLVWTLDEGIHRAAVSYREA